MFTGSIAVKPDAGDDSVNDELRRLESYLSEQNNRRACLMVAVVMVAVITYEIVEQSMQENSHAVLTNCRLHYPESHMYIPNFILIFTTIAMAFAVFFNHQGRWLLLSWCMMMVVRLLYEVTFIVTFLRCILVSGVFTWQWMATLCACVIRTMILMICFLIVVSRYEVMNKDKESTDYSLLGIKCPDDEITPEVTEGKCYHDSVSESLRADIMSLSSV